MIHFSQSTFVAVGIGAAALVLLANSLTGATGQWTDGGGGRIVVTSERLSDEAADYTGAALPESWNDDAGQDRLPLCRVTVRRSACPILSRKASLRVWLVAVLVCVPGGVARFSASSRYLFARA
jgi:hypothetical protein